MRSSEKLAREFYTRPDTLKVARELLGRRLVVPDEHGRRVSGLIVETEAYCGVEDKASHAYGNRRTARTESMYARGGMTYVYFIYGMYHQFNVVTGLEGLPHAVLIRAVEPVEGIEWMQQRRPAVKKGFDLTNGPGKLCLALGIDRSLDRQDLCGQKVWIEEGEPVRPAHIASGPRVGINYAEEYVHKPWRFWVTGNRYVSPKQLAAGSGQ